jgi:hypothetical protein
VTPADVEALVAFLDGKVRGILAGHRSDTDVWKAALGLRLALNHRARQAREAYARADLSRETARARFLRWNRLAVLALGWEKDPDYNQRWKVIATPVPKARPSSW